MPEQAFNLHYASSDPSIQPSYNVAPGEFPYYFCDICQQSFKCPQDLNLHAMYGHAASPMIHCKFCNKTFYQMSHLNIHTAQEHTDISSVGLSHSSENKLTTHQWNDISPVAPEAPHTPLCQLDGNVSPASLSPASPSTIFSDPAIVSTGSTSLSNVPDTTLQFQYNLNASNQACRLIENTNRPAYSIRYSNPQTIKG